MRPLTAFALAALISVPSVHAGETPWQEVAPGVSVRLISTGKAPEAGKVLMGLEFDMPPNTKTYWRVPGQTGLATQLDLSASRGVGGHAVHWPHPRREERGGYLDHVYYGHVLLPVELAAEDGTGMVDMRATMGICSEICIPAQARFVLPLRDAEPDRPNELRIRQALAEVPVPWESGPVPVGAVSAREDGKAIAVEVTGSDLDVETLIVATGDGRPLFGAPQKSPQGALVVLPILGKTDNSDLNGMSVELTFMTQMGAYSVNRIIGAGAGEYAAAQGR